MSINNTNRVPSKNATNITHNVNLSFDIGTSHIHSTDTNEAVLKDVEYGVDTRAQNDRNETVDKDVKDILEDHAMNDDGNIKSHDIRHRQIHDVRSGYSRNCIHNLGNP